MIKKSCPERDLNTYQLLNAIAYHLSTRQECSKKEYAIRLSSNIDCGYEFDTQVLVFPDRYHRKNSDKDTVIHHILAYHLEKLSRDEYKLDCSKIVEGDYRYILSVDGRRRKWVKVTGGQYA